MYKQLKHFLRRVIGYKTIKSYLLSHGESIVFVNHTESFEEILRIIKTIVHKLARDIIDSERVSRMSIKFVVHDPEKWERKLKELIKK